jgi:hypothetical protein
MQGKVKLTKAQTRQGLHKESGGRKMEGGSCWKSSGGRMRLYTWLMADEARSDTIPRRGGR